MEDHQDILARYKRMRAASREMNNALLEHCRPSVKEAAKDLGVWVKGTVVMDIDEMPVLMDHAIHHRPKGGRNVVERYAAEHPAAPGSDSETVLAAMGQAFFSLFQVSGVVEGIGVRVTDILRDHEHLLADVRLSQSAAEGVVLASRVVPFEGFIMTTGAALPVSKEVLEWVARNIEERGASHQDMRDLPPDAWSQIETSVMRACLQSDGDQQIEYQDVPGSGTTALSKDPDRVGRNEPCPCGSGKKFKKCCGA